MVTEIKRSRLKMLHTKIPAYGYTEKKLNISGKKYTNTRFAQQQEIKMANTKIPHLMGEHRF